MGLGYHDEQTWNNLDPSLVQKARRFELERVKKRGGYANVPKEDARRGASGK